MSRNHAPQRQNRFIPQLEALEDRFLLSSAFVPPQPPLLPQFPPIIFPHAYTGAETNQFGSLVYLNLGFTPSPSLTIIVQDGQGDVALESDGGPFQILHHVSQVDVHSVSRTNYVVVLDWPSVQHNFPVVNLYEIYFSTTQGFLIWEHLAAGASADAIRANGHSFAGLF